MATCGYSNCHETPEYIKYCEICLGDFCRIHIAAMCEQCDRFICKKHGCPKKFNDGSEDEFWLCNPCLNGVKDEDHEWRDAEEDFYTYGGTCLPYSLKKNTLESTT